MIGIFLSCLSWSGVCHSDICRSTPLPPDGNPDL